MARWSIGDVLLVALSYWLAVFVVGLLLFRRRFPVERGVDGAWTHFILVPYHWLRRLAWAVVIPPLGLLIAWLLARG